MSTVTISPTHFTDTALLNDETYRAIIIAGIHSLRKNGDDKIKREIERATFPLRQAQRRKQ